MVDAASIPSAGGCRGGPGAGRGESIGRARSVADTTGGPMIIGRPSKPKGFRAEARAVLPADLTRPPVRPISLNDARPRSERQVTRLFRGCQRGQGIPGQAVNGPLGVGPGPQAVVEA